MRVQLQVLSPRMQDRKKTDARSQMLGVPSHPKHRLSGRSEQQIVEHFGVVSAQRIELVWQRKYHMEVGNFQQLLLACCEPALAPDTWGSVDCLMGSLS